MPLGWTGRDEEQKRQARSRGGTILALVLVMLLVSFAALGIYVWLSPRPLRLGSYAVLGPPYANNGVTVRLPISTAPVGPVPLAGPQRVVTPVISIGYAPTPRLLTFGSSEWILMGPGVFGQADTWATVVWQCGPLKVVQESSGVRAD